jgi:serine/threonine protein kinase
LTTPGLQGVDDASGELHGTGRFELRRYLGAGGFGVVYEAYDREHDAIVALKTLQQLGPGALYRFKQEFRALADIDHPNLITLYELSAEGEHWFFTMELVEVDFLSYVSPPAQPADSLPSLDLDRLRDAFRELAEGVRALHQAGKLHCDLKPSNVLVERTGRVVILDFGLVAESDAVARAENNLLVGTPAYMSPEQAGGLEPTPASDWYSVGVMLFEALTGRQPFRGSVREILEHKRRRDPPAPDDLVSDLPSDLKELCCRLLSRDRSDVPLIAKYCDVWAAARSAPLKLHRA